MKKRDWFQWSKDIKQVTICAVLPISSLSIWSGLFHLWIWPNRNFYDDSIMLAWRHHFPIISLWENCRRSSAANCIQCSDLDRTVVRNRGRGQIKQNGNQCKSWWDGSWWAVSSGSTLFVKICFGLQDSNGYAVRFPPICSRLAATITCTLQYETNLLTVQSSEFINLSVSLKK